MMPYARCCVIDAADTMFYAAMMPPYSAHTASVLLRQRHYAVDDAIFAIYDYAFL